MINNNKIPRIRVSGYDDEWVIHRIGDYLTLSKTPGHTGVDAKKLTVKLWGKHWKRHLRIYTSPFPCCHQKSRNMQMYFCTMFRLVMRELFRENHSETIFRI